MQADEYIFIEKIKGSTLSVVVFFGWGIVRQEQVEARGTYFRRYTK